MKSRKFTIVLERYDGEAAVVDELRAKEGTTTFLGVPVRTTPMPDGVLAMLVGDRGQRVYVHTDGTTSEAPARCAAHGLVMCSVCEETP